MEKRYIKFYIQFDRPDSGVVKEPGAYFLVPEYCDKCCVKNVLSKKVEKNKTHWFDFTCSCYNTYTSIAQNCKKTITESIVCRKLK